MASVLIGSAILISASIPAFLYLLHLAQKQQEEKLQKVPVTMRKQRQQ